MASHCILRLPSGLRTTLEQWRDRAHSKGRRWEAASPLASVPNKEDEGYPAQNVRGIANKEIARATMKPGVANPPIDPFRIGLKPDGAALTMTLAWGERTWSVDLTTGK